MRKFMKNKKLMAWVVLLTFLFSCVMPTNLSAGNSLAEAAETLTNASQVELNPTEQVITDDGMAEVKMQKSIAPSASGKENEFDITLTVSTPEKLEEVPASADAAVILVMDVSNSMKNNKIGNETRLAVAKRAAQTFVETYANKNANVDGKRLLSLVRFYQHAEPVFGWVDVAEKGNDTITANGETVFEEIEEIAQAGGTNLEGGLQLAYNMINKAEKDGTLNGISNVTVVLLTDGAPSVLVTANKMSTTQITGGGIGTEGKYKYCKPAVDVATLIKSKKINNKVVSLKTVVISDATTTKKYQFPKNQTEGKYAYTMESQGYDTPDAPFQYVTMTMQHWLGKYISPTYLASNAASMVESFENIANLITLGTQAWQVTDPMADNIVYTGNTHGENANNEQKTGNTYSFKTETATLLWNLKDSYPIKLTGEKDSNNVTWYTYQMTYPVRLDNTTAGFQFGNSDNPGDYATNDTTVLDYFMFSKVTTSDTITLNSMKHANFDIPAVEGYKGDLVFNKIDSRTNKALDGAEFTLTSTCDATHGHAKYEATATSANGKVKFENIPSGHTYTLSETKMAGYQELAEQNVTVSYGEVTGADGKAIEVIANVPETADFEFTKTYEDADNSLLATLAGKTTFVAELDSENIIAAIIKFFRGGVEVSGETTVTADTVKVTFTGLEFGKTYTVKETAPIGYDAVAEFKLVVDANGTVTVLDENKVLTGNADNGYVLENKLIRTSIEGTKTWIDPDGTKHPDITINLLRDGVKKDSVVLKDGEISYKFENLQKYDLVDGHEYAYTVKEDAVSGYTTSYEKNNVINTIEQDNTVSVRGTKTWIDPEGTEHPDITINLLRDNVKVDKVVLKNGETNYEFNNLPKYDLTDGHVYDYTVEELTVEGYNTIQSGTDFTNVIEQDTVSVKGTKTWVAPAGTEYPEITINLLQDGKEIKEVKLPNGTNEYSFDNLDKYDLEDGHIYKYTVTEDAVPGYTTVQTGNDFKNTIVQDNTVSVKGTKTWIAPAGTEHPEITINLLQDGKEIKEVKLPNGTIEYSFDNLPRYDLTDGHVYEYTVTEDPVEGYNTVQSGTNFTNTIEQAKVSVEGTKTWIVPEGTTYPEITINLLKDGKEVDEVVLKNGATSYKFENLDKYDLGDGHVYKYTVTEDAVAGYTTTQNGTNFTNTIAQAKVHVSGEKTWIAPEGTVHPTITINLLKDGVEVDSKTLANGTIEYSFDNLDKYDLTTGKVHVYTVEEEAVEGYTTVQSGTDFTNTIKQVKVSVEGTKTWIAPAGTVHPEITINLLRDGNEIQEVKLQNGTNEYSFTELDKYSLTDGHEYVYTVTEDVVDGYTSEQTDNNFTNTIEQVKVKVEGKKIWNDANNQDGKRPTSITINLLRDGKEIQEVKLQNGTTEYSFTELDKYNLTDGHEYVYTVTEDAVKDYTTVIDGYTITNTHVPEIIDIPVAKVWDDKDDQDGKRPSVITVELYKEGKATGQTLTLEAADNWVADEFTGLAKYADGKVINYSVREVGEDNNEINFNGATYKVAHEVVNGVYTITNSYTPETTEVSVEKVWADNNNQDGIRPNEITVQLKVGDDVKATQVLSETNDWKYTFEGLAKYAGGQEIAYTVDEVTVVGDYTKSISGDRTTGFIITNTHTPETTSVSGVKTWVDGNNADGLRPNEITVKLLADGKTYTSKTVTAKDGWKYTFDNLPVYENGQKVVYTIGEDAVKDYIGKTDGHNLINTIEQDYKHISVVKTWENAPVDADGKQILPEAITLVVTQDGAQYGEKITVTEADSWKATVANLPKYDVDGDGHKYKYAMYEEALPGYVPTYKLSKVEGKEQYVLEITNTYIDNNNVVDVAVEKVWQTNAAEVPTITINLMQGVNGADGIVWKEVAEQQLTNGNTSYKFVNQPKYYEDSEGNKWNYVYKVTEDPVKGYTTNITGDMKDGFTIYNTANDIGQLVVSKTATGDNKPAADTKYDFVLLIDAGTVDVDLLAKQNGMRAEANELAEAAEAAKAALQLAEENFVNTTFITTASEYQFIFYDDNHRALYGFGRTTPGVYDFHSHDHGFVVGTDHEQQNLLKTLIDSIVDAIKSVFAQMGSFFDIPEFMDLLKDEVEERNINTTPSALAFHFGSTVKFMEASREAELANSRAELALEAVDEFKITTPSAISVTFGKNTLDLTPDEKDDYFNDESKYYVVPFSLASGESLGFEIETANIAKGKSASIQYMVVEQNSYQNNLENTTITVNDNDGERKLDNNMTGWTKLSTGSAYSYAFLNAYSNNTTPPPPGDPEPPTPPTIPDPPTPPTPPEEIEVVDIPDEDVPLAEPGIEIVEEPIEEPDIPMGDAPPTGDTANAVPFVCLLLVGLVGFLVSRTKFN